MAKKTKKPAKTIIKRNRDAKQSQWMLRFKAGSLYVLFWLVVVAFTSQLLPNPTSAQSFFQESHALWFIHLGFFIVLLMILFRIGQSADE